MAVTGTVAFVRQRRAQAFRERVAPEYAGTLATSVPAHSWGPPDTQRPVFDAPGGMPYEPDVVRVLLRGPSRNESTIGALSTLIDSTLVTTFYYAGQIDPTRDEPGSTWLDACAHVPLPVRVPFTYIVAKTGGYPNHIPGTEHVSFESDDFNRLFIVFTTNREFATTFVSERAIVAMLSETQLAYVIAAGADVIVGIPAGGDGFAINYPELTVAFVTELLESWPDSLRMPSAARR